MVPDVGNPPVTLFVDDGLVRTPGLKVVGADQFHVALFSTLLRERISAQNKSQHENCKKQMASCNATFLFEPDFRSALPQSSRNCAKCVVAARQGK